MMLDQQSKCVLNIFEDALKTYEEKSLEKISKILDKDQNAKTHRKGKSPIVFDADSYRDFLKVRDDLCKKLPKFKNIIISEPEIIMDDLWLISDYLELYINHYKIVIEKLRNIDVIQKKN